MNLDSTAIDVNTSLLVHLSRVTMAERVRETGLGSFVNVRRIASAVNARRKILVYLIHASGMNVRWTSAEVVMLTVVGFVLQKQHVLSYQRSQLQMCLRSSSHGKELSR
jgi:hypothetical protein